MHLLLKESPAPDIAPRRTRSYVLTDVDPDDGCWDIACCGAEGWVPNLRIAKGEYQFLLSITAEELNELIEDFISEYPDEALKLLIEQTAKAQVKMLDIITDAIQEL